MDALTFPNWRTISSEMRQLLQSLGQLEITQSFYLAGGTALALQIGHRRSYDFDFFSETDSVNDRTAQAILAALEDYSPEVIEKTFGNLVLVANNVRTGFFSYGYPLIQDPVELEKVKLASIMDIGLMKCDALITRGSRKDFYDLYCISSHLPLSRLLDFAEKKYTGFRDFPLQVLEAITLFENADRDFQPDLIQEIAWEAVKQWFVEQAKELGKNWFGD
ncbi:MAG: nucleotidyl transferase AbiEii/AbiGii toxin family protein [Pelolinea sp.]|nr:nucleotidyl transferase AbiEii/AbiGii toxin family protein [Pelolinea sp.]